MLGDIVKKLFGTKHDRDTKSMLPLVEEINQYFDQFQNLSEDELIGKTEEFKRRLSDGETVDEIIRQTIHETPDKPSNLTEANVPTLLEDAAMQCIEKSIDKRMSSCAELVRLLEEEWS